MDSHQISAISTSVIAFMTIIGLMFGFYYNLRTTNTRILHIIIFECSVTFTSIKKLSKKHEFCSKNNYAGTTFQNSFSEYVSCVSLLSGKKSVFAIPTSVVLSSSTS